MEFRFYNQEKLILLLKERGIPPYYRVCDGCVFTHIPPEDCFHNPDDFQSPSIQIELFCQHCHDTIEDSKEKFYLYDDKDLTTKIRELEAIARMAFES